MSFICFLPDNYRKIEVHADYTGFPYILINGELIADTDIPDSDRKRWVAMLHSTHWFKTDLSSMEIEAVQSLKKRLDFEHRE